VLSLIEPAVPVTVTMAVTAGASEEAMSRRTEVALSFALGVTGSLENLAVTPRGSPVALSVTAELKPSTLVTMILLVLLWPWMTVRAVREASMVKVFDAGLTIRRSVVDAVPMSASAATVTVYHPVGTEQRAVSVSKLDPGVELGLNDALIPLGRPDRVGVTGPVNPVTMTVAVAKPH